MITLKRFTICMTLLLITAIGCMFWIYFSQHTKINHLQAEVNILWNYKLNEPFLKSSIVILEAENTQLQQQLDSLNIYYVADKLYIDKLESNYLMAISYINVAELVLHKQGIQFLYTGER